MNALKLIFLLVIFPLLLTALGGWERQRAESATAASIDYRRHLVTYKQQLQEVAAMQPVPTADAPEGLISVQEAIARLERNEAELPTAQRVNHARRVIALWVMGLGLVAALIGVAALLATHWAGQRAQQSRETLLQVFSIGSRWLPTCW